MIEGELGRDSPSWREGRRESNVHSVERKLEEADISRSQVDLLKLGELEVENAGLRQDMARLRSAVANGGEDGEDNQAVRELSGNSFPGAFISGHLFDP